MRQFFNFLLGVFSGALIGAIVALLFAPMSGDELRSQVQTRGDRLISDIKAAVEEERKRLEAELEALKKGEILVN